MKFIKAVHGNISAAGKFFVEGMATPSEDEIAEHSEVINFSTLGYLKIFNTLELAKKHTFRTMAERAAANEDVSKPVIEEVEEIQENKTPEVEDKKLEKTKTPVVEDKKLEDKKIEDKKEDKKEEDTKVEEKNSTVEIDSISAIPSNDKASKK